MMHACNPSYVEVDIGGLWFEASPCKKLVRHYLKNKLGMVADVYRSSYVGGEGRRIVVRGWSR
jgi:hypothetical protein